MARRLLLVLAVLPVALAMTGCDPALVCTRLAVSLGTPGCGEQATLNSPPVIRRVDTFRISPEVGDIQRLEAQAYDPDGDELYYEWDLDGDGEFERRGYTSTAEHQYTSPGLVNVHLRVSDFPALPGGEGQATASKHFRVHTLAQFRRDRPPTASFTIAPNPVERYAPLTLDASASQDPDGDPLTYEWEYSNEQGVHFVGSGSPTVTTSFERSGQATIELTVADDYGRLNIAKQPLTVSDSVSAPRRPLQIDPNPARVGQTVTFVAAGLADDVPEFDHYEWDLDGLPGYEVSSGGAVVQRSYPNPGDIFAGVRVVNGAGVSLVSSSDTLHVTGPAAPGEDPHTTTAGPTAPGRLRASAARSVTLGAPRPFSARLTGRPTGAPGSSIRGLGKLRASLSGPPKLTTAERTLKRVLSADWRTRLQVSVDPGAGTAVVSGVARAVPAHGRDTACVRIRLDIHAGAIPRGTFEVIGGRGAAARLRGEGTFRFRAVGKGPALVVGSLRAGRGRPRTGTCA